MCGIKNVLAISLLLGAAYARPDGYGVKGVKSFGATANAAASAHAFANTGFGGSAIAQSSASASADANTGGASGNAAATANAFANGENIGKAISSASAIANANHPIGRSDVLDQSNDREKDTEYKTTNHQDGTPAWDQDIANAGHGGCGNNGNSAPGSIDLTNSATVCHPGDSKCRNLKNKPSVANPYPTYNEHPDLSAGSSQPLPNLDGGWGGNTATPGSRSCTSGNQKCSAGQPDVPEQSDDRHVELPANSGKPVTKPSVSNPYPSYNEYPVISAGSSQPLPNLDGGWGGNTANPGQSDDKHVELSANSGEPVTKPSVSNPYPSYNKHPDLSAGSSQPLPNLDGGWGGTTATPVSRLCTSGNQKCSGSQPDVPNPDQSHDKHVGLSVNYGRPVTKPGVSNPYPSYNKNPDLSSGSSQPLPNLNGGRGGNTATPVSRPCTSGNQKCSAGQPDVPEQSDDKHVELSANSGKPVTKPSVSNPYPTYNEHPDLSAGSSQPLPNLDGGWGGNTDNPGSRPCTSGNQKCSGSQPDVPNPHHSHDKHVELSANSGRPVTKPSVSNPHPTYNEHPDLPAGSSQPLPNLDGGWGGNTATPGSRPCTSGTQECSGGHPDIPNQSDDKHVELPANSGRPVTKPSVSNPYPSYNKNTDLSAGSSRPLPNLDGGYGGHKSIKPTGGRDGVKGSSHQHPTFNKNPVVPSGSSPPSPNLDSDCGGNSAAPGSRPCTSGSSGSKPGTSNPFLNGEIDVSEIQKDVQFAGSSPESSPPKPNPSNPFLNPHSQHPSTSSGGTHHLGNPYDKDKPGSSTQHPEIKPNPLNPFLNPHSQQPPKPTGSTHHSENPNNNDQGRPSDQYPESKPNPSNPFLNPHGQHPSTPTGGTHNTEKPNNNNLGRPSDQYPESKPNPSNPFLNPHNQHPSPSTAGTHDLENQNGSDKTGPFNKYPHNQQSPYSNPTPTHHGHDEVKACSHGSCKPKGPNAENDADRSDADTFGNGNTSGGPSDGVKSYRPGVKGGSAYRPQSSVPIKYHDSARGDKDSAFSNASWDAYSKAHATASSSAGGDSSAHAKSQAYSSADTSGSSGWSNSWASSSASASASAYSSSSH